MEALRAVELGSLPVILRLRLFVGVEFVGWVERRYEVDLMAAGQPVIALDLEEVEQ